MDEKGEKEPSPGTSERPSSPWLWAPSGEEAGQNPESDGETGGLRALTEEEIGDLEDLGPPAEPEAMLEEVAQEEEVVRLGVEEDAPRPMPGGSAGLGSMPVDRRLDDAFEGDEDEELELEDTWEEGSRRGSPIGLMVLTGLVVVGVLGVAFWRIPQGDARLSTRASAVSEKLANERKEETEAARLMDLIERALRNYLAAGTVEEKAKYVRQPERVLPLMRSYYAEHELVPQRYERVKSLYPVGVENYPFLVVQAVMASGAVLPLLLQQVGDDEIRFDWESEVAYQPMSIEEFLERRPEEGVDFRVYVKFDQFYAFEFADSEEYVSLMLTERNSDGFLFGYVERGSEVHEEVAGLLDETEARQEAMLLKLRFLPGSLGTRSVLVEDVVAPRWAYVDREGG